MRRPLLRWLATLLLAGACLLPAPAQQPANDNMRLNATPDQKQAGTTEEAPAPVFSYFIAIASTILILFTLLKPTRKRL